MKKTLILILIFQISLLGYDYDKLILEAQTSIFPKLILLDKNISKKALNKTLTLCIVFHSSDNAKSQVVKKMIEEKFKGNLDTYKLKIILKKFDDISEDDDINAYYILQGEDSSIKKVCNIAQKRKKLTFSYDIKSFENGTLISLVIYNKSLIYLNKSLIKLYDINFVNAFYHVVKFIDE